MAFQTVKDSRGVEAVGKPDMAGMSLNDYQEYIEDGLLYFDPSNYLCSKPADYPIATNKEQLRALIAHLRMLEAQLF